MATQAEEDEQYIVEYTVTLRFPQTIRFDRAGLERWLEPSSPPFKRLVAKNMAEDWDYIFGVAGLSDECAESVIDDLASHIVSIVEND